MCNECPGCYGRGNGHTPTWIDHRFKDETGAEWCGLAATGRFAAGRPLGEIDVARGLFAIFLPARLMPRFIRYL